MSLANLAPIGFIPTQNAEAARTFYEHTLGLRFESDDDFAIVFSLGSAPGTMLRVIRAGDLTPASYTIFGWEAPDIEQTIDNLTAKGVAFLRYSFLQQDERAIWHAPNGDKVAWFKDPDGNTLSLSQHS